MIAVSGATGFLGQAVIADCAARESIWDSALSL